MKYKDYKEKSLSNPNIKKEYDALKLEYDLIQTMIDSNKEQNFNEQKFVENDE